MYPRPARMNLQRDLPGYTEVVNITGTDGQYDRNHHMASQFEYKPRWRFVDISIWRYVYLSVRRSINFTVWRPIYVTVWRYVYFAIRRIVYLSIRGAFNLSVWRFIDLSGRRYVNLVWECVQKQYPSMAIFSQRTRSKGI